MREQIINFIKANGWAKDDPINGTDSDYDNYYKENNIGIDIGEDEVVLIGEEGDFEHFQINPHIIYTMIGYLLEHRFIACDYIHQKK